MTRDEGYKQCAVVTSDRALGEPTEASPTLLAKKQKNSPAGVFYFFVAGDEGFEPPNGGTRTHCLTTWRIPIGLNYSNTINTKMQNV